jgi:hypothetical protein
MFNHAADHTNHYVTSGEGTVQRCLDPFIGHEMRSLFPIGPGGLP